MNQQAKPDGTLRGKGEVQVVDRIGEERVGTPNKQQLIPEQPAVFAAERGGVEPGFIDVGEKIGGDKREWCVGRLTAVGGEPQNHCRRTERARDFGTQGQHRSVRKGTEGGSVLPVNQTSQNRRTGFRLVGDFG